MVQSVTYSNSIFDAFGSLSSFNFKEAAWGKYEKFAIRKLEKATAKLSERLIDINLLTPKKAESELNSISFLIPILEKIETEMCFIEDIEFRQFKTASLDFIKVVNQIYLNLHDISDAHSSYELSHLVLSDWDEKINDHWDNY